MISAWFAETTRWPLAHRASYWQVNSYSQSDTPPLTSPSTARQPDWEWRTSSLGHVSQFSHGHILRAAEQEDKYIGLYGADTWKLNQKLTLNYGLRWEPYFPVVNMDGSAIHFDEDALEKGIKTTRFTNAPPGVFFNGDPGFPGIAGHE